MFHKLMFTGLPMILVAFVLIGNVPAQEQFQGTVVEAIGNQVIVQDFDTGEYRTFIVEEDAEITLDGQRVELAKLLPFFQANVVAEFDGIVWFAQSIEASTLSG